MDEMATDDPGLLLYGALAIAKFLGLTERQVRHRVADGELPTLSTTACKAPEVTSASTGVHPQVDSGQQGQEPLRCSAANGSRGPLGTSGSLTVEGNLAAALGSAVR